MNSHKNIDPGLETLLDLNGEVFPMDNGYWTKFEARRVEPSDHIPHGIRYSLTLHDRSGKRVLGFDNAHRIKPQRQNFTARKVTWDHKHERGKTETYKFDSAGQLMQDFWEAVNRVIG